KPAWANTWAMPLPIVPAPITPTVLICGIALSRSHDGHEGTRGGFVQHVLRGHRKLRVFVMNRRSNPFDRERDAVAAAQAERRDAAREISPLQRVQERRQDAAAARADRVAQCDGAAVHVHFFG